MAEADREEASAALDPPVVTEEAQEQEEGAPMPLVLKWNGQSYEHFFKSHDSVLDLKRVLYSLTEVHPDRQKLVNLKRAADGSLKVADADVLGDLVLKAGQRIMMVGTPDREHAKMHSLMESFDGDVPDDVVNDLDWNYHDDEGEIPPHADKQNLAKVAKVSAALNVSLISQPREGSRLLVLDLDYTLFDMKSKADSYMELKRPHTDEFLTRAYQNGWDLVVWSQTSWRWLELKLTELGILSHPMYRICFVLDKTSMFRITSRRSDGQVREHYVKPLQIIFDKFPGRWGPHNCLHVDDLSRNFALNPRCGLKIKAYDDAPRQKSKDKELLRISEYLEALLHVPDFSVLDHDNYRDVIQFARAQRGAPSARGGASGGGGAGAGAGAAPRPPPPR